MLPTTVPQDPYVTYFYLIIVAAILLVATPCSLCIWKGWCKSPPRPIKFMLLSLLVASELAVTIFSIIVVSTSTGTTNTGEYYKCYGVRRGVATGNTFPVPQCFEDRTTPSASACSSPAGYWWPILVVVVVFTLLWGLTIRGVVKFCFTSKSDNVIKNDRQVVVELTDGRPGL